MTTNNRLQLTSLIEKLPDDAVNELIEKATALYSAKVKAERPCCPRCQSTRVVKNGHKCGKQEYLCRGCGRTFVSTTNTLMANSHQPVEVWEGLIRDTIAGHALDYSSERLGITHDCAFHMRHKFLLALQAVGNEHAVTLGGVTELDETFVLDSYKGKKLPESVERKPRKHGEGAQKRGLSHEFICICAGVERDGASMAMTVNRAKPSSQEIQDVFYGHLSEDALALCDGLRSYSKLGKAVGCSIKNVELEDNHKFFHLNTVNSFHSFIKKRYVFYRGVATKYLNRYNALFGFAFRRSADAISKIIKLFLDVGPVRRFYSINNTTSHGLLEI